MKWIKASEQLPKDHWKNVIIRHLRTREVGLGKTMGHDTSFFVDFAGWNSTRGQVDFKNIEWLDESPDSKGEDDQREIWGEIATLFAARGFHKFHEDLLTKYTITKKQ